MFSLRCKFNFYFIPFSAQKFFQKQLLNKFIFFSLKKGLFWYKIPKLVFEFTLIMFI